MREDWRGPHEGKELDLMLNGTKPISVFTYMESWYRARFMKHFLLGKFLWKDFIYPCGNHGTVFAQLDQENNMNRLIEIMSSKDRPHAEIGRLLGYKEEHIAKFVDYIETI